MAEPQHSSDSDTSALLTNKVLLNVCSFFETFYELDPKLFSWPPLSPQDWLDELSASRMSPNLNFATLQMLQMAGLRSRAVPKKPLQYLPNDQLQQLLLDECAQRTFILHCAVDVDFTNSIRAKHTTSDSDDEDGDQSMAEADACIPWHLVSYAELPLVYKVSVLQNLCDWMVCGNRALRKVVSANRKALSMRPLFVDAEDAGTRYFLFGEHSLNQCLYREANSASASSLRVYGCSAEERARSHGLYFGDWACVGVGVEGIARFAARVEQGEGEGERERAALSAFLRERLRGMELLSKKKARQLRRTRMRQLRMAKDFACAPQVEASYEDAQGNRRSARMRGKTRTYADVPSDDGEESESESEEQEEQEDVEEDDEPQFYPSGRSKRSTANKKR